MSNKKFKLLEYYEDGEVREFIYTGGPYEMLFKIFYECAEDAGAGAYQNLKKIEVLVEETTDE